MSYNEPTNPVWPENVLVFHGKETGQEMDTIKEANMIDAIKEACGKTSDTSFTFGEERRVTYTSGNHFSTKHYALLFAPGEYENCKFEVGYYVQMAGLGRSPKDVKFTGEQSGPFVEALNKDMEPVDGGSIASLGSVRSLTKL